LCTITKRYERSDERKDTRAGYYKRKPFSKAGEIEDISALD
jgi:transposase-like protein